MQLGDYLGQRPVILSLNYFTCPNLCPLTVQDLASALGDVPFELGSQYSVLTVSIDPTDTPALAQEKKDLGLEISELVADLAKDFTNTQ